MKGMLPVCLFLSSLVPPWAERYNSSKKSCLVWVTIALISVCSPKCSWTGIVECWRCEQVHWVPWPPHLHRADLFKNPHEHSTAPQYNQVFSYPVASHMLCPLFVPSWWLPSKFLDPAPSPQLCNSGAASQKCFWRLERWFSDLVH